MTGGAGFARDAINSLRRNRALLKKRKKMADNPYSKEHGTAPKVDNYDELQQWKIALQKSRRKTSRRVVGTLVIVVLLLLAYFVIFGV